MKTLPMLMVAMLLGASAVAVAGEDPAVATITVTAKRAHSTAPAERTPPKTSVEIAAPLPTDMPEMEIDSHMTPIDVASEPVVAQASL